MKYTQDACWEEKEEHAQYKDNPQRELRKTTISSLRLCAWLHSSCFQPYIALELQLCRFNAAKMLKRKKKSCSRTQITLSIKKHFFLHDAAHMRNESTARNHSGIKFAEILKHSWLIFTWISTPDLICTNINSCDSLIFPLQAPWYWIFKSLSQ